MGWSAELAEEVADVTGQQRGLFHGGEMTSAVEFGPVHKSSKSACGMSMRNGWMLIVPCSSLGEGRPGRTYKTNSTTRTPIKHWNG